MMYINRKEIKYHSPRYDKRVTVPEMYESDGATGAIDIYSDSWWVHDVLCERGTWDDGSKATNWQASTVLSDILAAEGHNYRSKYWWIATWLFGGGQARKNGMF
ncbi:MAG: hypothetical protein GY694_15410 [Gammaproteobacteria bacterium]|nr:hypothetical protein [Gammaproteobacteria bacterium]